MDSPQIPMRPDQIQERYAQELDGKHKLDSRLTTYVAIISVIGGLLYFAIHEFTFGAVWFTYAFALLILASAALYAAAFVHFYLATFHPDYAKLPTPSMMDDHRSKLESHYGRPPVEAELDQALFGGMLRAIDHNWAINKMRGERYFRATRLWALSTVLAVTASTADLVWDRVDKFKKPQTEETKMANEEKPKPTSDSTTSGQGGSGSGSGSESDSNPPPPPAPLDFFKGNTSPLHTRVVPSDSGGKDK